MSPQDQSKVLAYVQNGGHVIVGPGLPYLDATLKPASVLGQYLKQPGTVSLGQGRLTWAPADNLADVVLPTPEFQCDQPQVEICMLQRNGTNLLALANSSGTACDSTLTFGGARTFRSVWGEAQAISGESHALFRVPGYSVQIWEVD
jgi:hypothetical protein